MYERAAKYNKAIAYYKESLEKESNIITASRISSCYDDLGDYDKALEYCNQAIALDSVKANYLYEKANILDNAGRTQEAIKTMSDYIANTPDEPAGYYQRGWFKDHSGDIEGALEDYTMAITLQPNVAYAYLNRGVLYRLKGENAKAESDFKQVVRLDSIPEEAECSFYAYYYLGQKDKAIEILNTILDKDKKGNCYDAACLYSVMGEKEKALSYLRQSLEDGYRRFAHIKRDRDLNNIRNTEEFKVLMKEYEEKHLQEIAADADGDDSAYELKVEEIPFTKEGGVCKVKCAINGLPLHFIFDTGATDVSISSVEATFMAKNDFLSSSDIIGKQNYQTADGNITEGTIINLKDVKLGSLHLNNIKASVVRNQAAPLLLGQSVLSKLGKIEIDNTKKVLRITHKQKSIKYNYIMEQKHHYTGLTDAQVLESRQRYGVNVLTPLEKETIWDTLKEACTHWISISMFSLVVLSVVVAGILVGGMGPIIWSMPAIIALATVLILIVGFFGGFGDSLFKILIMAFVLSMGISIYEYCWVGIGFKTFFEPIGIIVALILATSIAFVLERRNEKTFQSLNVANDDTLVKVIRNNNVCQVPRKDIVVGDIVLLETGEEIPADCELLQSLNLNVNESSLTGELQCAKTTDEACFDKEATYPSNQIMKGTIILEGYCVAKVTKVGDATESGKVFEAAQVKEGGKTPLSEELGKLAKLITYTSYVFAVLIIIGRIGIYFYMGNADFSTGEGWINFVTYVLNTIMIAVTLIVVAVPEGLPMSVTLSLAFSMKKLMKENTLPRTMHSCETMGATSVICTDKTGTLTQNRMLVADTHLENISNNLLAEMIAINTTANLDFTDLKNIKAVGNPTECALLLWLNSKGFDYIALREK